MNGYRENAFSRMREEAAELGVVVKLRGRETGGRAGRPCALTIKGEVQAHVVAVYNAFLDHAQQEGWRLDRILVASEHMLRQWGVPRVSLEEARTNILVETGLGPEESGVEAVDEPPTLPLEAVAQVDWMGTEEAECVL